MLTPARFRLSRGILTIAVAMGLLSPAVAQADTGIATWYGPGFQGNVMYNGQRFDMYDPTTAAANIFPIGTWVRVTNPANGRSVVVQIRDRGAFRHALDLSYAAFRQIADPSLMGIRVNYEVVSGPDSAPAAGRAQPATRGQRPGPARQYFVQPGDTLDGIAARVGISPDAIAAWNNLADPNLLVVGQVLRLDGTAGPARPATASSGRTYVVQAGDTLSDLAARFGITVQQIAAANGLTNPDSISEGQTLVIPGAPAGAEGSTYTVQAGDTLSDIAARFGVDVAALQDANHIADPTLLQPGTILVIPHSADSHG